MTKIVALAGGVGGAKLVHGLAAIIPPDELTVIVNTGDDFVHYGLKICPDLDTVCYTLAGIANPNTGWGIENDTWAVLETLEALDGETWFRIGDRDLATHLERTRRLNLGDSLSDVTRYFCTKWGIKTKVLPMSDDDCPTIVLLDDGEEIAFQEYFVKRSCEPVVRGFRLWGASGGKPTQQVLSNLSEADLVVLCPSNPWVSIDPILALPGIKDCLIEKYVIGVSPIIGGKAVKGPAAKMFSELGIEPSALSVAKHYQDILSGFIIDIQDRDLAQKIIDLGIDVHITNTYMKNIKEREHLAGELVSFYNRKR